MKDRSASPWNVVMDFSNLQKVKSVTIEIEEMETDVVQSVKLSQDGTVIQEDASLIVVMD